MEEKDDYFEGEYEIRDEVKQPVAPQLEPDNPDYWEQPESEFEHLKPTKGRRWIWWGVLAGVVLAVILFLYFRYFSPYVEEATQYGYVEQIEREGLLFKTYEGVLLPYKELMDTTRVYREDFVFSANSTAATELRRNQYANRPVRVVYRRYYGSLPWRGNSRIVVDRVDTVNPAKILPPEFQPRLK